MPAKLLPFTIAAVLTAANFANAQSTTQSPAARPRPKQTATATYPADQLRTGEQRFSADCGFCHGRDASGGESGPDLTRSDLVATDTAGDKLGPFLRAKRPDGEMPTFDLNNSDLIAITAFLHTQATKFAALGGGRGAVDASDLTTGNAADGRAYFNGTGQCSTCHSSTGDLKTIATRYQGLALLQRMLYPTGRPAPAPPKAIFSLENGQTITAPLAAEDEFSVTVLDPLGARQTYSKTAVKVRIDSPLDAHFTQLAKYTDTAMHNVLAYLQTLK